MDRGFLLLPELSRGALRGPHPAPRGRPVAEARETAVRVLRLAPRETLWAEGSPAGDVYEVAQGVVLVWRMLSDGRRQIVDVVGPGRLFGFTGRDGHRTTAVVATAAIVFHLDRSAVRRPHVAERIAEAALTEIDRLRDLALLLGRKTAIERVASFLLSLVGDGGAIAAELVLPLTRSEMADHLGLTIETVSRCVGRLKRLGLVAEERGDRLVLPDCRALAAWGAGEAAAEAPVPDAAPPQPNNS